MMIWLPQAPLVVLSLTKIVTPCCHRSIRQSIPDDRWPKIRELKQLGEKSSPAHGEKDYRGDFKRTLQIAWDKDSVLEGLHGLALIPGNLEIPELLQSKLTGYARQAWRPSPAEIGRASCRERV